MLRVIKSGPEFTMWEDLPWEHEEVHYDGFILFRANGRHHGFSTDNIYKFSDEERKTLLDWAFNPERCPDYHPRLLSPEEIKLPTEETTQNANVSALKEDQKLF
jgi:hypothetical protein